MAYNCTQVRQKGFENENNDVSGIVGEQENQIDQIMKLKRDNVRLKKMIKDRENVEVLCSSYAE